MQKNKKSESSPRRLILVDAHAILHRAYHALPEFASPSGEPTGALYGVATFLMRLIKDFDPDYIVACYDLPGPTFRHESYKEYKATRIKADDALIAQMDRSRDVFSAFGIPIYDKPGFEADDMLGTIVEATRGEKDLQVVVASGDMDTLQLVDGDRVVVYTLKKGINDTIVYNEAAVRERFGFSPEQLVDYKGLRGDPSDNIPGIPGIGEKTGTELVQKFGELEGLYRAIKKDRSAVEAQGVKPRIIDLLIQHEEEALFSKILAMIRRDAPIDFALPEKTFREAFSKERASALFSELGFRSLIPRLDFSAAAKPAVTEVPEASREAVSPEELSEAALGLWLLDSSRSEPDQDEIVQWAGTKTFREAHEKIRVELRKTGLDRVLRDIELPLSPLFREAEKRGILIDRAYLAQLSADYHRDLEVLQKKIWNAAGGEFNINSPKQLGEVLFVKMGLAAKGLKKTPTGAQSTRDSELEKLAGVHPIIDDIRAHRELQKLLSTYIDVLPGLADAEGRVHTHFVQTGAATGRISSRDPNLQNIPIKSELGQKIRRAFVADRGCVLLDIDYSQIELRVLAMLSGDEKLLHIFKTGGDIHEAVAREVFKAGAGEVTKEMRRKAKVINFGIIYGMGVSALQKNLGTTRAEAQLFYDNYFAEFPGVAQYIEAVKAEARKNGYTETFFGRRRYFPNISRGPEYMRAAEERMAMNAPNQGTAADILKIAIIKADTKLRDAGLRDAAHLLLQVHDELVYEVKRDKVEQAALLIKEVMERVMDGNPKGRGVPLAVNVSVGENWGETEGIVV